MRQQESSIGTTDLTSTPSRRWYQFTILHLLVAMTLLAAGSAILAHMLKPKPVEVQGRVTIDGKPLSNGLIAFVLTDGKKKQRYSQQIRNGSYAFSDVIESCVYSVEISSPRTTGNVTIEPFPQNTTVTQL